MVTTVACDTGNVDGRQQRQQWLVWWRQRWWRQQWITGFSLLQTALSATTWCRSRSTSTVASCATWPLSSTTSATTPASSTTLSSCPCWGRSTTLSTSCWMRLEGHPVSGGRDWGYGGWGLYSVRVWYLCVYVSYACVCGMYGSVLCVCDVVVCVCDVVVCVCVFGEGGNVLVFMCACVCACVS